MSNPGDLVALLAHAEESFSTFRGEYRVLFNPDVSGRAERRQLKQGRVEVDRDLLNEWPWREDARPDDLAVAESRVLLWAEQPDRYREQDFDEEDPQLLIRDGHRWWHYNEDMELSTSEDPSDRGSSPRGDYEVLVTPAPLSAAFTFEVTGSGERAGRRVIGASARRRDQPVLLQSYPWGPESADVNDGRQDSGWWLGLPPFGNGDDLFEFEVNAETGLLLRVASRFDGEDWTVVEAVTVAFDQPLPDDTFLALPGR